MLSETQKDQICSILAVGCDRETAANFVETTTANLHREMERDDRFAARVHRTEAASEWTNMRTVHQAAKDVKNWRAAVWWLEMHAPDRFKSRSAGEVTLAQLNEFVGTLTTILANEVRCESDRRRVIHRVLESIRELEKTVRAGMRLSSLTPEPRDNLHPRLALIDDREDEED